MQALLAKEQLPLFDVDPDTVELQAKEEALLAEEWRRLEQIAAKQAKEELREYLNVEEARELELELEEDAADRARGLSANPDVTESRIRFDFTTKKLPKKTSAFGFVEYRRGAHGNYSLHAAEKSYLVLPVNHFSPNGGRTNKLNMYTVCMEVRVNRLPAVRQALFRTARPTSVAVPGAEISLQSDGAVGFGMFADGSDGKLRRQGFSHVVVSVNATEGHLGIYIDGVQTAMLTAEYGIEELLPDGPLALDIDEGLVVFGAAEDTSMLGGQLASVAVYDRDLRPQEVSDLYQAYQAENSWQCMNCTFVNTGATDACICGAQRSGSDSTRKAIEEENPILAMLRSMGMGHVTQADIDDAIGQVGENPDRVISHIMEASFN